MGFRASLKEISSLRREVSRNKSAGVYQSHLLKERGRTAVQVSAKNSVKIQSIERSKFQTVVEAEIKCC